MDNNIYTATRLKVIRECLRKHYYRYELGIRGPETDVIRFGTVAHAALEAWFRRWHFSLPFKVNQSDSSPWGDGDCDPRYSEVERVLETVLDVYERAKLSAIICAYDCMYGSTDWEVIAVEVKFVYFLGDVEIRGKIDAIIRDLADGRVWVLEHKTTGQDFSAGSPYWQRLSLDTQVSVYLDGAKYGLGYTDVAGVIYDVLARPRHEPKLATPEAQRKYTQGKGCKICGGNLQGKQGTGVVGDHACSVCKGTGWRLLAGEPEAPKLYEKQRAEDETPNAFAERIREAIAAEPQKYLMRGTVVRLDSELEAMRRDLLESIAIERNATALEMHPRNDGACASFGSMCSFFPICSGAADIADERRFPRGPAHPELTAP